MAEFGNPEVVEEEVDILLIGGGMACCGAGFELMRWADLAKQDGHDLKIKLIDNLLQKADKILIGLLAIPFLLYFYI